MKSRFSATTSVFLAAIVALFVTACQHREVRPVVKPVPLVRISTAVDRANPLVYRWALPSGDPVTLRVAWKPHPKSKPGDEIPHGAITRMELSTATKSFVFPKYSYEQLWSPNIGPSDELDALSLASLDGSDEDLVLTFGGGDGGGSWSAIFRVLNGELKSALPIRTYGAEDWAPATEPEPAGMRKSPF